MDLKPKTLAIALGIAIPVIAIMVGLRINPIQVVVNGLQIGSVYALVALGIALVYKSTKVLNFAQGELGSLPAMLVLLALLSFDRNAEIGAEVSKGALVGYTVAAMAIGAILAILINVAVVQRLKDASPVTSLVATAGVMLFFLASQLLLLDANAKRFPRFVDGSFSLFGVPVQWQMIVVLLVIAGVSFALSVFFRTPVGVGLLATSQEPFAAELHGISTRTMSTVAWGAAGAFAALGGVLGAGEFQQYFPGFMTATFLVPAFTGAVLGGITSIGGAVSGSLLLGIAAVFANEMVVKANLTSQVPGPPVIMTFVILLAVLFVRPRGLFGKEA
jgi:branched-chain amino acid transport system permease protein